MGVYIKKISHTVKTTMSIKVLERGKSEASVMLPTLPTGASYGKPTAVGPVLMTELNIASNTLIFSAPKSIAGQTGTITIPVTSASNYDDYNLVVTVTYMANPPSYDNSRSI